MGGTLVCTDHLGNEFKSKEDRAKHWGMPSCVIEGRLKRGWSLKDVLETPATSAFKGKIYKDHLGNQFSSEKGLAKHWNIGVTTLRGRLERGWSLKDALETPAATLEKKKCTDHLGNYFESESARAKHWGKTASAVRARLKKGWSLKDALETPSEHGNLRKECVDHLGNHFKSESDRAKYWGIGYGTVNSRLKLGWSLKDALETPGNEKPRAIKCTDHLGNEFKSDIARAKHWNLGAATVRTRLAQGWSLKDALEKPTKLAVFDHLGNGFGSLKSMAEHWNKPTRVVHDRLKAGWSLKDALEKPYKALRVACIDHLGNKFESKSKRAEYWGQTVGIVEGRIEKGWSLKDALETPVAKAVKPKVCYDHQGNKFESEAARARHWGKSVVIVNYRLERGLSLKEALEEDTQRNVSSLKGIVVDTVFFGPKKIGELSTCRALEHYKYTGNSLGTREYLQFLINSRISEQNNRERVPGLYINFVHVSTNLVAYYKVPWSNELKTSREVVQHYLPDLLEQYDKVNPSGTYRPMMGKVNPNYRQYERALVAGRTSLDSLLKKFNLTIEEFNHQISDGASVDEALTGKKDQLVVEGL